MFCTAFGTIPLVSPRFHRCRYQPSANQTFSPLTALFTEHTAPELLYLEGVVSLAMAVGVSETVEPEPPRYQMLFI